MTVPTHNAFIRDEAWVQFTAEFNATPDSNWQKLHTIIFDHVQDLEDMWFNLTQDRLLSTALGQALDVIGIIVGEARGNLTDADYRRFLRARLAINRSDGQHEQLVDILQTMSDAVRVYLHTSVPDAIYACFWVRKALSDAVHTRIKSNMDEAIAAGVRITLVEAMYDDWLGFAADSRASGFGQGQLGKTL